MGGVDAKLLESILAIAVPELYERARSGEPVWLSLWHDGTLVAGPAERKLRLSSGEGYVSITTDDLSWAPGLSGVVGPALEVHPGSDVSVVWHRGAVGRHRVEPGDVMDVHWTAGIGLQ